MIIGTASGYGPASMGDWKSWLGGKAKDLGVSAAKGAAGAVAGKFSSKKAGSPSAPPASALLSMSPTAPPPPPPAPKSSIKPWHVAAGVGVAAIIGYAFTRRGR